MYDSSYSYFKIDCGGSPSLTFYSDAGCTTMGSTISQGTCETTLSSSYAYQFSCPSSYVSWHPNAGIRTLVYYAPS